MLTEIDLLHVFKKRENFERFKPLVKEHALTDRTLRIVNDLEVYYNLHPNLKEINWNSFGTWFKMVKNAAMKKADMELYSKILENVIESKPSETTENIIKHFVTLDYAGRMMNELEKIVQGKGSSLATIETYYEDYLKELKIEAHNDDDYYSPHSLTELLDAVVRKDGLEWKLEDLNIGVGPLHKGDYIIVATRPEVGKTTFTIDQVMYMYRQLQGPTRRMLWVNNEEDGKRLMLRAYQSVLNKDIMEILRDEKKAMQDFGKAIDGQFSGIKIYDKPGATVQDIERQCKKYEPTIIVFNVMDKVHGFAGENNEVYRLRKLFQWARELAKKYGIVFALVQADGSAEGQKWIFQDQIFGSKTPVQGEADVLITIGAVHDPKYQYDRYIHVPKNKLPGGPRTNSSLKHGYFEVTIDPERATFRSKKYVTKGT